MRNAEGAHTLSRLLTSSRAWCRYPYFSELDEESADGESEARVRSAAAISNESEVWPRAKTCWVASGCSSRHSGLDVNSNRMGNSDGEVLRREDHPRCIRSQELRASRASIIRACTTVSYVNSIRAYNKHSWGYTHSFEYLCLILVTSFQFDISATLQIHVHTTAVY